MCYRVDWKFALGRGKQKLNPEVRNQRWEAVFVKQSFITNMDWRLDWAFMKRYIPESLLEDRKYVFKLSSSIKQFTLWLFHHDSSKRFGKEYEASVRQEKEELETWLKDNYPGMNIKIKFESKLGYSYLISGIFLQLLITAVLGALTKFQLGNPRHSAWILVWIYGGPLLRWKWLINESLDKEPCLSARKWFFYGFTAILSISLRIAVCGGIASICVELLASICNTTFALSIGDWIALAAAIAATFIIIGFGITYFTSFASKARI
jgi:hypothetical protein